MKTQNVPRESKPVESEIGGNSEMSQRLDTIEPVVALAAKAAKTAPASGTNVGGIPPSRVTPGYKGGVS